SFVNGVASFSGLTLDKAGAGYTLQATSTGLTSVTSGAITVVAAPATQLTVSIQPPATVAAGNPFNLVAAARDPAGNIDPNFNGTVTLAIQNNPSGTTLGGTVSVQAVNGVATFPNNLTLNATGSNYTLQASALLSSGQTASVVTNPINVTPAPTSQLVLTS